MVELRELETDTGQDKKPEAAKSEAPAPVTPPHTVQMHAPVEAAPVDAGDTASEDAKIRTEALLDKGIELSFPASDPVAPPESASAPEITACADPEEDLLDLAIELTFPASDPIAVSSCHHVANESLPVSRSEAAPGPVPRSGSLSHS